MLVTHFSQMKTGHNTQSIEIEDVNIYSIEISNGRKIAINYRAARRCMIKPEMVDINKTQSSL